MSTSLLEMQLVLRQYTDDPKTWAEFYEAAGAPQLEREERLKILRAYIQQGDHKLAVRYHEEHLLLSQPEFYALLLLWCEKSMERGMPYEALDTARKYHLGEMARRAALTESERILGCKQDPSPALEIARRERADDADYVKRAARHAFKLWICGRNFSSLPGLVSEFRPYFTDQETDLAEFLAKAEKERQDRRYAKLQMGKG